MLRNIQVQHDTDRQRFVAERNGKEANLQYRQASEGKLDYQSTFVPEEYREQGIGERIVMEALDFARKNGYEVIPSCPFVRHVLEEHPEYDDVVAREQGGSETGPGR
ncbi:MAG: GNAT family N-acetyltransferase [Gemmatimonadota bacterium]